MKARFTLDTVAAGILVFLAVLVGLVILLGVQAGVRVAVDLPKDGVIAPFQTIKLTFSEAVNSKLASSVISIDPAPDGKFEWVDSRTVQFVPTKPFELNIHYKLTLSPNNLTTTGHALKKAQTWEFRVRDPLVVYLSPDARKSSIWAMDLNGNPPHRLTGEKIQVVSFDASPTGEFIVFTVINKKSGVDLWRVSRAGNDASILLDCGLERCTRTAISPDGTRIAYSREAAGNSPGLPFGSPRTWVLDLQSGQNSAVYEDQKIIGYGPSWSPDSKKLASFDGLADQIRLLDLADKKQYTFPSNTGGPITWSADSKKLLFTDIEQRENGLVTRVRLADLSTNDTTTLVGANDASNHSYRSLAWSPVGNSIVLGFHVSEDQPGELFQLFDPDTHDGITIAQQEDYSHNSPQWDPWGKALIFQQFKMHGVYKPEIGLWKPGFNEPLVLAEGLIPHWLP